MSSIAQQPVKKNKKTKLKRLAKWVGGFIGVIVFAIVVAYLILIFWLTPRINEYREDIETYLSVRLNTSISIESITATPNGLLPQLHLKKVKFLNPDHTDGLLVEEIQAALSTRALFSLQLRLAELTITEPEVYIQRHANGHFWVVGIDITELLEESDPNDKSSKPKGELPPIVLWLLRQPQITLENGLAQWVDHTTTAPSFELNEINASLRSSGYLHSIKVEATPPKNWGDRFNLNLELNEPIFSSATRLTNWNAKTHIELPRVDIKELPQHLQLPVEILKGNGSFIADAEYKNSQLISSQIKFNLPEVEVAIASDPTFINLNNFNGTLNTTWINNALRVMSDDLSFEYAAQSSSGVKSPSQHWPISPIDSSWSFNQQGELFGGFFKIGEIDLEKLSEFMRGLPLPSEIQEALTEMNTQGIIEFLDLTWRGPLNDPHSYALKGSLKNLQATAGIAPPIPTGKKVKMGRPGVSNLSLNFLINEKEGSADIMVSDGSLTLPGVYNQPIAPIEKLQATFKLEHLKEGQVKLSTSNAEIVTPDAKLQTQISWVSPDPDNSRDIAGHFTLNGVLIDADATAVYLYLPNSIQPKVRDYLQAAFVSGTMPKGTVTIDGPLVDFPYHYKNTGTFLISGKAENATYNFAPSVIQPAGQAHWPTLTQVSADMQFTGKGMLIRNASGKILNAPNTSFYAKEVSIPNWSINDTHVLVDATITGSANELLSTVNRSALGLDLLGGMLSQADVSGQISSQIQLDIMLDKMSASTVKGDVKLNKNTLSLWPFAPVIQQATGNITFSQNGFSATDIHAQTLGGELSGYAHMDLVKGLDIDLKGDLTAEGLFKDSNWGRQLVPDLQWLGGKTDYTFKAYKEDNQQVMQWSSDLEGLSILLPEPLDKPTQELYPLQITLKPLPKESRFLPLFMEVNSTAEHPYLPHLQALYLLTETPTGIAITQGAIGLNQNPVMPLTGTSAQIRVNQLNVPKWQTFLNALPPSTAPADATTLSATNLTLPLWWPQTTTVYLDEFQIGEEFSANKARLDIARQGRNWGAFISSKEIIGHLYWQAPQSNDLTQGQLSAKLPRLWLPSWGDEKDDVDDQGDNTSINQLQSDLFAQNRAEVPFTLLPNTSMQIDHLQLGDKRIGSVELDAKIDPSTVPARWHINQLDIMSGESLLKANGYWEDTAPATTSLNMVLETKDAGDLINKLGYEKLISGANGSLQGNLHWQSLPYDFNVETLGGELNLELEKGQVLFADQGAGRLLNVLSLQSLPSRLSLDFRDLFSEGFAFDSINGNFQLNNGQMAVNALDLHGVAAKVNTTGHIDLNARTQQLDVTVTPSIDLGTASLALTAVNPAVGLGSLLAQLILKEPIQSAATRSYSIDGSWDEPNVINKPRKDAPKPSKSKVAPSLFRK